MTDEYEPPGREHHQLLSNAGRCDICGSPIEMSEGDTLAIMEFGVEDEVAEEHGVTDQEAADAVAEALERVGKSGADYDLAETIREDLAIRVHDGCLDDETQFDQLLRDGGRVIQFGYTTTNMPLALGYEREEVAIFNTLGRCNDYLASVDVKPGEPQHETGWFDG